jgi:hypothetical protein
VANYKSRFERQFAKTYPDAAYEPIVIPFKQPAKRRKYTPDFELPNGVLVELKGLLSLADRQKMVWVRDQHPELDIRFMFMNAKLPISRRSRTNYGMWCDANGFDWCEGQMPTSWLA